MFGAIVDLERDWDRLRQRFGLELRDRKQGLEKFVGYKSTPGTWQTSTKDAVALARGTVLGSAHAATLRCDYARNETA